MLTRKMASLQDDLKDLKKYILESKLQKIVKLVGYKENPDSYIKISDVFVLTSIYEGLPNVLIETLYLKKYIFLSITLIIDFNSLINIGFFAF